MLAKTAVAMASKPTATTLIFDDYNYSPQFIAEGAAREPRALSRQGSRVQERHSCRYPRERARSLPRQAGQGGRQAVWGLPPGQQLGCNIVAGIRKAGLSPAETWGRSLSRTRRSYRRTASRSRAPRWGRGFWAGAAFITLLRCHGGDWFDKMEPGRLEGPARHRRRPQGDGCADAPRPLVMELTALNASDDEANTAMLNGTWTLAAVRVGAVQP